MRYLDSMVRFQVQFISILSFNVDQGWKIYLKITSQIQKEETNCIDFVNSNNVFANNAVS